MSATRPHTRVWSLGLLCALAAGPAQAQPLTPERVANINITQQLGEQLPLDLRFVDETGQEVVLQQYFGSKPIILVLAYYECPMLCTQVLNGLVKGIRPLSFDIGQEFDIVTVSIDPGETPEMARAKQQIYLDNYTGSIGNHDPVAAAAGWHFLTGTQDQIDRLTQAVGFNYEYDPDTDQYMHASGLIVLTPAGQMARYFYGIDYAPKELKWGLIEAANHTIGSPVDQLLLLCYQYDPLSGRYGLVIRNALRVGGGATLLVLATFVITMLRRERRQTAA
ncbi:MAG: SCO family protein [Candidatus Latescibacteria bacterium]|nr:SCO family protein [Candidatus Latescibacterota bacterium]